MVRRALRIALIPIIALLAYILWTLPPRARASVAAPAASALAAPATIRGAYHIHTTTSDGTGTPDEVAAAAARAGLQFIILTDHGDATRTPTPPTYRSGVLCIDGVEISTTGGHYAALGLTEAAPYRLAGEPRDVVEDVRRLGGFGIAAHPDSPKRELRWTGWDTPFDGVEWLNEDTEWRDESTFSLLIALAHYGFRPAETLGALDGHARTVLDRWDQLTRERRIVALAAVDAHAKIGLSSNGHEANRRGPVLAKLPSYESSFRAFTLHLELPAALTGDAPRDADAVLTAIRSGHVYSTIDALAQLDATGFVATSGGRTARMGDFLPPAGPVNFEAAAAAPAGATLRLLCDGKVVAESPATGKLRYDQPLTPPSGESLPGACRVEVGWDDAGRRVTWLVTNPIYLRESDPPVRDALAAKVLTPAQQAWRIGNAPDQWGVEHDAVTVATGGYVTPTPADPDGPQAIMQYTLRSGGRVGQFAALQTGQLEPIAQATRVSFWISADRPMRISVQLRAPLAQVGQADRWRRFVYVDKDRRNVTIMFDDMLPVPGTTDEHPRLPDVRALLFVVDDVNTVPGTSGKLSIGELRLEH